MCDLFEGSHIFHSNLQVLSQVSFRFGVRV